MKSTTAAFVSLLLAISIRADESSDSWTNGSPSVRPLLKAAADLKAAGYDDDAARLLDRAAELGEVNQEDVFCSHVELDLQVFEINRSKVPEVERDSLNDTISTVTVAPDDPRMLRIIEWQRSGVAKLLVSQKLTTEDAHETWLHIGNEIMVPSYDSKNRLSVVPLKFGTSITAKPTILSSERLKLDLYVGVSERDDERGVVVDGRKVPGRRIQSLNVTFGDAVPGKTYYVGGQVQTRVVKSLKTNRDVIEERELIVLMTPRYTDAG